VAGSISGLFVFCRFCRFLGPFRRGCGVRLHRGQRSSWLATEVASCLTSPPSSLISLTTAWMRSELAELAETTRPSTAASRRPELGDLTRQIGGAARQIRNLAADVGAVPQPHRDGVVQDQEGQRRERDDRPIPVR